MITLLSWENINGKEALVWVLTKRGFDEHTHAQTLILDVYASISSTYTSCTRHSRTRIHGMLQFVERVDRHGTRWPTWWSTR